MTTQTATRPRSRARRAEQRSHGERPVRANGDSFAGQQLATSFLVRGCEQALFDLRCSLGAAKSSREVRTGLEAIALLEDILASWRETLAVLLARGEFEAAGADGEAADTTRRPEPAPS